MPGQERQQPRRSESSFDENSDLPDPAPVPAAAVGQRAVATDADIDDVLDEIDGVLESNAEEFVAGFVQKGGE